MESYECINKIVLVARDDGERGMHFVTWKYCYDRKSMGLGHYRTRYNYELIQEFSSQ